VGTAAGWQADKTRLTSSITKVCFIIQGVFFIFIHLQKTWGKYDC
jgi:hypothetical protein